MTRINVVPPFLLLDQHLVAEKKEINQLAGQFLKSRRSRNFDFHSLPNRFSLGTGHVRFFYKRGGFVRKRYAKVYDECIRRGFNATFDFNDVWDGNHYNLDYEPTDEAIALIKERIISKVKAKPNFYRYMGKKIDTHSYINCLEKDDMTGLRFQES